MRNWVDTYVRPRRREFDEHWDSHAIFDEALKVLMIDIGWQKAFMPPELGGWGAGNVSNIASFCTVVFEEMSRGDLGMNIAFASGYWSLLMIAMKPEYNMRLLADLAPLALGAPASLSGQLLKAAAAAEAGQYDEAVRNLHALAGQAAVDKTHVERLLSRYVLTPRAAEAWCWRAPCPGVADILACIIQLRTTAPR